jgi:hypothetical protein
MPRLGVTKKKKSSRVTERSQLKKELKRVTEQLESRDREQTATSEILRVIASSPKDVQPVLDVVAENAARLCDATNAVIMRVVGEGFERVARYGDAPVEIPSRVEPQLVEPFWTGELFMWMTSWHRSIRSIQMQSSYSRKIRAEPSLRHLCYERKLLLGRF